MYVYIYIYVFFTHAYLTDPECQSLLSLHFLVFKQLQHVTQNKGGNQLPWNPFAALHFFSHQDMYFGCSTVSASGWCVCYLTRCACVFFGVVLQRISVILILTNAFLFMPVWVWLADQNNIPSSNTSLFKRIISSQTFSEFSSFGMPLRYPENA